MRNIINICRRESLSFFVSPVAYFVITGFALLGGYFFFLYLSFFNIVLQRFQMMRQMANASQMPNLNSFVIEQFFSILLTVLVFLIPLLTMRVFAEEKKRGTFELLLTSPLSVAEIVWGKFFGVVFVLAVMLSLVFIFPLLLCVLGDPGPELWPILSGFLGVLLFSFGFASIGMAVSSFTENQIVAGVSSMVILLLLYLIQAPGEAVLGSIADVLNHLSPINHAREMLAGVISLKAIVYFLSLMGLGIFISSRAIDAARWR